MSQRHCWIIQGPAQSSRVQLARMLAEVPPERILHCGSPQAIRHSLGRDCDYLIFDTHAGFFVDAFAAALGALRGGGVCFILLPSWDHWPDELAGLDRLAQYPLPVTAVGRRFITRVRDHFAAADWVRIIPLAELAEQVLPAPPPSPNDFSLTDEQQEIVSAVLRVALGHAKRPLVICADRGRGKSTALGVALARLLVAHPTKRILVLAPSAVAVQQLLAQLSSPDAVHFCLPEVYRQNPLDCDLMVVDEAAAIPLPILTDLVQHQNRIVFSSTVQGYEGSGRGFALRFSQVLQRVAPQWRSTSLEQPVRWSSGDRLEALLNNSLLLALSVPKQAVIPVVSEAALAYKLCWFTQQALAQDEACLREVVALLVSAHYQTRPSDLQHLLDAPGLQIVLARRGIEVIGVLLAVVEGGFDDTLCRAICAGKRRPQGHLLVQSLACHAGLREAPRLRLLRIQRIAVAIGHRRQGIGQALLSETRRHAQSLGLDGLGVAFALDADLLAFWHQANFRALRIGQRRDPASGSRSVLMMDAWSAVGLHLVKVGHARLQRQLPWMLGQTLSDLEADVVAMLMYGRDCADLPLDALDHADVAAARTGQRHIADVRPALWRWFCHQLALGSQRQLCVQHQQLLLGVVLQNRSSVDLQNSLNLVGKKAFQRAVREALCLID